MGLFANPETLFDNSTNGPTVEQALQQMRDNQRAIMELEGAKPTEVCTISTTNINTNGTIYPSCAEVVVTLPENTDSLSAVLTDVSPSYERTTGVYEMLHDGMVVSLKSEFNSYQIELVSSETLRLKTAERITLSHLYPLKLKLVLGNNGDYYWEEVPSAGTHSGDITSIAGDLDVSGKIRSNGALLEKKLAFDSTPVYDVTLAGDITIQDSQHNYEIVLETPARAVFCFIKSVKNTTADANYAGYFRCVYDDETEINVSTSNVVSKTYDMTTSIIFNTIYNLGTAIASCGREDQFGFGSSIGITTQSKLVSDTAKIEKLHIWLTGVHILKAGSQITIYAAKEVE